MKSKAVRKMEKVGKGLNKVVLDKDPKKANLEMRAMSIMERAKEEGING